MNFRVNVLLLTFVVVSSSAIAQTKPMIVAHRGASAYKTENTVSAFVHAFELDADAIEMDVWRTTDDRIVVIHDRTTERVADKCLVVPESSLAQLKELNLKGGEKIPTFEEVIAVVPPGKKMVIEIKCGAEKGKASEVFPMLKDIISKSGRSDDCIFISFQTAPLVEAKRCFPDNKTYFLTGEKGDEKSLLKRVTELKFDGLNINYGLLTPTLISEAEKASVSILVWTVDDPNVAKKAAQMGVTAITTNKPDLIRSSLGT